MATSFLGFLFALCTMTGCEKKSSNPETPANADNESPQESLPLSEGPGRGSLARRTLRTAASAARANSSGPAALLTPARGGRGLAPETPARGGRAPAPRDPAGVLVTAAPGEQRCKGRRDGLSRPGTDGVTRGLRCTIRPCWDSPVALISCVKPLRLATRAGSGGGVVGRHPLPYGRGVRCHSGHRHELRLALTCFSKCTKE